MFKQNVFATDTTNHDTKLYGTKIEVCPLLTEKKTTELIVAFIFCKILSKYSYGIFLICEQVVVKVAPQSRLVPESGA